jgi:hypothetical protein
MNVLNGVRVFKRTGVTPPEAYQSFVRLFCLTGGISNEIISKLTRMHASQDIPRGISILQGVDAAAEDRASRSLTVDGYVVLERALPEDRCARLLEFATGSRTRLRGRKGEDRLVRGRPEGVRYDFFPEDVVNNADVQALMCDSFLLRVAQRYLSALPIADVTSMWWHTDYSKQPDEDAAQFYHFDLDRPKWLKVFCYLTDVGPDNGPHCFVQGSHRNAAIPWRIRSKGYVRLTDEEVEEAFGMQRLKAFTAPAGTIVLEDTRGLHKGLHVRSGDRLMLQLQFSDSLFGGAYPPVRIRRPASLLLEECVEVFPTIFSNYIESHCQRT